MKITTMVAILSVAGLFGGLVFAVYDYNVKQNELLLRATTCEQVVMIAGTATGSAAILTERLAICKLADAVKNKGDQ